MKPPILLVLIIILALVVVISPVTDAAQVVFSNISPLQGEAVTVKFLDKNVSIESAIWNGKEIPFFRFKDENVAVIPVAASLAPGFYTLRVTLSNGEIFNKDIRVRSRSFSKVVLGPAKESSIKPEELAAQLEKKKVDLEKIFSERTDRIFFNSSFGLPLYNNRTVSTPFGTIYKTGTGEIRHLGIDWVGKIGTPVAAINSGYVRKAYFDSVYGNSVILDHGRGIFSYYIHLNEINVREGDFVKKGRLIGTIGQTGYATAPHLHLSIKVAGISVDPLSFISALR